jgi:hypothetical protein
MPEEPKLTTAAQHVAKGRQLVAQQRKRIARKGGRTSDNAVIA